MKLKPLFCVATFVMFLSIGFSQCGTLKISETIELDTEQDSKTYYQHWVAGVRGGGSGINVFISKELLKKKQVDSMYFNGRGTAIESNGTHYIGYFKGDANQLKNHIIATETVNENTNSITKKKETIPFELMKDEVLISFSEDGKTKYLKLINIKEKESLAYPSAPKNSIN